MGTTRLRRHQNYKKWTLPAELTSSTFQAEQSLVAANRELIEQMVEKIQAGITRVWGGVKLA